MFEVTGTLEEWVYDKGRNVLVGRIYNDTEKRWPDGYWVYTSGIVRPDELKQGDVVETMNSYYLLGAEGQTLANNGQFDEIYQRMVDLRIACPQFGYPYLEALYYDVAEYEASTGLKFWYEVQ